MSCIDMAFQRSFNFKVQIGLIGWPIFCYGFGWIGSVFQLEFDCTCGVGVRLVAELCAVRVWFPPRAFSKFFVRTGGNKNTSNLWT